MAGKPAYLISKRNGDGSRRWYWQPNAALRQKGHRTRRLAAGITDPNEARRQAEREAIDINHAIQRDREQRPAEKAPATVATLTVNDMILEYRKNRRFRDLKPKTRREYEMHLSLISEWIGPQHPDQVTTATVERYLDTIGTIRPAMAEATIRVLRLLYNRCEVIIPRFRGRYANPAEKLGLKGRKSEIRLWSRDEVRHMTATADAMGLHVIGTAITVNHWLGQREGDILDLTLDMLHGDHLDMEQNKTGARGILDYRAVPEVIARMKAEKARRDAMDVTPLTRALLLTPTRHVPLKGDRFRALFRQVRDLAATGDAARGLAAMPSCAELKFMWLRHTAVTRLYEANVSIPLIASVTLHELQSVHQILKHYGVMTRQMSQDALRRRVESERDRT